MSTSSRSTHVVRWLAWLLTLAACLLPIACSGGQDQSSLPDLAGPGSDEQTPDRVVATIMVQNDELTLIDLREANPDALPPAEPQEPKLVWELESENGELVASGAMTAPMLYETEFDSTGKPAPEQVTAGTAVFEVELPNVGGTFTLSDGSSSGTQPQSWGGFLKKLKVFIQKLVGKFTFKPKTGSGTGGASAGGTSAGGTSAGGTSAGGTSAGGSGSGGTSAGGSGSGAVQTEVGPNEQVDKPESPCTAFTILVVAEGYTKAEEAKFNADAATIIAGMSKRAVYAENWKYVSVWRKFFVSKESGISDPANAIKRDTAFRVEHNIDVRRAILMAADAPADSLAKLAKARGETKADVVLVVANTSEYAGVAIPSQRIGFASTHEMSGDIMGHELAHALFSLADEYSDGVCNPDAAFKGPNVATDLKALPWSAMLTKGVALPTTGSDPNVVGAYEGAIYCAAGAYRPQHTCYMRELGSELCEVCKAHVQKMFDARTIACQPKGTCSHSECKAGDALTKGCSACSSAICTSNPECCDPAKGWTDACVKIAQNLQGACRGVCADNQGSCAHNECTAGTKLPSSCSTCAAAVCKRDAFCCSEKWDAICATEAAKDPYCGCGVSG